MIRDTGSAKLEGTPSIQSGPSHALALDAFRGFAALLVFVSHLRALFFLDYGAAGGSSIGLKLFYLCTGLGHQAVMIFFVLSGYLVGGSALRTVAVDAWSWKEYLFARFTRLYIVLIPALICGVLWDLGGVHVFGIAGVYGAHGVPTMFRHPVLDSISPVIFLGNLVFLQTIAVPALGSNGPLWSLANEFWYYVLFPCLLLGIRPFNRGLFRLTYLLLAAVILWAIGGEIASGFLVWLMGAALAFIPPIRSESVGRITLPLAVTTLVALLVFAKAFPPEAIPSDLVLGLGCACCLYAMLHTIRRPPARIYEAVFSHLAKSSYTLYLFHLPALVFIRAAMPESRWIVDGRTVCVVFGIGIAVFLYTQLMYVFFESQTNTVRRTLQAGVDSWRLRRLQRQGAEV